MSYSLIGIVERALVKVAQQPHVSLRQLAHFLEIDRGTLAAALQEAHLDLRALKRNWLLQAAVSSLRGGGYLSSRWLFFWDSPVLLHFRITSVATAG